LGQQEKIMDIKATAILINGSKINGRLTTNHAASSYGQLIFVDQNGQAVDWTSIREISTAPQMGASISEKKSAAVRENGKKGGRPRKSNQ
jgi:hypothetical protein